MYSLMQQPCKKPVPPAHCIEYEMFKEQSKYDFGYISLSPQAMPKVTEVNNNNNPSVIDVQTG